MPYTFSCIHSKNVYSLCISYLLLLEWQGISCLRLFSSICNVWLNDPSSSCTVTLRGPLKFKRLLLMLKIMFINVHITLRCIGKIWKIDLTTYF